MNSEFKRSGSYTKYITPQICFVFLIFPHCSVLAPDNPLKYVNRHVNSSHQTFRVEEELTTNNRTTRRYFREGSEHKKQNVWAIRGLGGSSCHKFPYSCYLRVRIW